MEKVLEMGKTSATGSFKMLVGVVTSTVIMAVGSVILIGLMPEADYGLYGVALTPSLMINLFRDWGVNSAMTRYVANLRAAGKQTETRDIIVAGLIFEVVMGLTLSFFSLFIAGFIASVIFHRPESTFLISIVSATILSGSLLTVAQSVFIGYERMGLNSLTTICQAIVKALAGPVLVILGYGVLGAAVGYTLSFVAAGAIGMVTLYVALLKPLRKRGTHKSDISKTLKAMLKYGVPLSISSLLSGVLLQFYSFMLVANASDPVIGNYQAALNFSVLLSFFTIPISTVLFPAFSKIDPHQERDLLRGVFASSVKYTALVLVPATMALMILARPMISTLFRERYASAPFFLTLYIVSNLFAIAGSQSVGSFLAGVGETKMPMKQSILTLTIGLPLAFILIPTFGVTGVILAIISAGLPSMFWGLYFVWKRYKVKADFRSSIKILAASTIAAAVTYASLDFIYLAAWIRLVVGLMIFLAAYVFTAPMIGAITQSEIDNLRTVLSGLGVISKIVNIPLLLIEKVSRMRMQNKKNTHSN